MTASLMRILTAYRISGWAGWVGGKRGEVDSGGKAPSGPLLVAANTVALLLTSA
jgi:hypothetical protein